jgi:hypothetical protein
MSVAPYTLQIFTAQLSQYMTGCPDGMAQSAIWNTIVDFYYRSGGWVQDIGPYAIAANTPVIDLNPVELADGVSISNAGCHLVLGAYLYPDTTGVSTPKWLIPLPARRVSPDTGPPTMYSQSAPDTLLLYPNPDQTYGSLLYARAILMPLLASGNLPAIAVTHHFDALLHGALVRLGMMPNKPWTVKDRDTLRDWSQIYKRGIVLARDMARRGYSAADATGPFPNFAGIVQSGQGALFPNPSAGQVSMLALEDTSGDIEYVQLTGRNTDTLTVVRAQENTTAISFASGSRVEVRVTAASLAAMLQKTGGDTLSGTTNLSGVLSLGSGGSIQGGEFTGALRSAAGVTTGQITVQGGQPMSGSNTILTSGNVTSDLPSGTSLCYTGMVVFWAGLSTSVPAGWHICDGTNGTPDLQDTFVFSLSVGSSFPTSNANSTFATGSTTLSLGSTDSHTLAVTEIPAHSHEMWAFDAFFTGTASGAKANRTDTGGAYESTNGGSGANPIIQNTGGGGGHTHGLSAASTASAHTHTAIPPYVGLLAIMKL